MVDCGGVIRRDDDPWVCGFAKKIWCYNASMTEEQGVYHGLLVAQELGFFRIVVEGDYPNFIQMLMELVGLDAFRKEKLVGLKLR